MQGETVIFRILRFKPGLIEPPGYQEFAVRFQWDMTVLDGLEQIRLDQDPTLIYRHCCHHASCGTCACTIDGHAALACTTRVAGPEAVVTLAPLAHHACIGDLAVDTRSFFKELDAGWETVRPCENSAPERTPEGVGQLMQLQNCIECGCCVAACPEASAPGEFMGPAVLAALNHEARLKPHAKARLMEIASDPRGARRCRRHLSCSRVCPSKVYPARHIADLLKVIHDPEKTP
jgi:succinate dehydrogenase / fumarate reductase iron-sulfur subunit